MLDGIVKPAVAVVASPTVSGLDRLDGFDGPLIFTSNHASHLDTPLLLTSLPDRFRHRTVVAGAADYFFDRRGKAIVSALALGAVPIDRTAVSRQSLHQFEDLLEDGWNVIMFPEGGRTPDGWAQEFKAGAAYVATRAGVPIVPVHLEGSRRAWRKGGRAPSHHDPCHLRQAAPSRHHAESGPCPGRRARTGGGGARRRAGDRLVVGPPAGGGGHDPVAARTRGRRLAPVVDPRRGPPAPVRPALAVLTGAVVGLRRRPPAPSCPRPPRPGRGSPGVVAVECRPIPEWTAPSGLADRDRDPAPVGDVEALGACPGRGCRRALGPVSATGDRGGGMGRRRCVRWRRAR